MSSAVFISGPEINLLCRSTSIDSDADGIVNAFDLFPFDGVVLQSTVAFLRGPPLTAEITWEAAANTTYRIEYATTFAPPNWLFLTNFVNSATNNGFVTFRDPLPADATARFYRVLYSP